jgi:ribose-phosphate pyrophosphokinase
MNNLLLISGSSNYNLSKNISNYLKIDLVKCELDKFKNEEIRIDIKNNIKSQNIVIIQSGYNNYNYKNVNDIIMETILLIDACRRSNAKSITLVYSCYPYARQDRKDSSRVPISASILARILELTGVTRVISLDLHSPQIQGFFKCPVDNLYSIKLVEKELYRIYDGNYNNLIFVAPDAGAAKRTFSFAKQMGVKTCIMHKERDYSNGGEISRTVIVCNEKEPEKKTAVIIDDIIDSGGTFMKACEQLINYGFKEVIGVISHGYFTNGAIENLNNCKFIKKIIITNSICQNKNIKECDKINVIDISSLFGEAIKKIYEGGTLGSLF